MSDVTRDDVAGQDIEVLEPAHDELLRGWSMLWDWIQAEKANLLLLRQLTHDARRWHVALALEARGVRDRPLETR